MIMKMRMETEGKDKCLNLVKPVSIQMRMIYERIYVEQLAREARDLGVGRRGGYRVHCRADSDGAVQEK